MTVRGPACPANGVTEVGRHTSAWRLRLPSTVGCREHIARWVITESLWKILCINCLDPWTLAPVASVPTTHPQVHTNYLLLCNTCTVGIHYNATSRKVLRLEGSGLYHFHAVIPDHMSYCHLSTEFAMFVDDLPVPYPLLFLMNFGVSFGEYFQTYYCSHLKYV